jgi:hypothetical protein
VSPVMAFVMGSESPELWLKIKGGKKFQTLRTYMLEHNDLNQAIFLQCTCLEARVVLRFFFEIAVKIYRWQKVLITWKNWRLSIKVEEQKYLNDEKS